MTVSPAVIMRINRAVTFLIVTTSGALSACGARGGGTVPDAAAATANCIGTCVPDPGSRPANCAAEEAGLEFFKIWDFESRVGDSMYSYTDRSTPNIVPVGFGPQAQQTTRCGSTPTWVMNIRGGPFRGWGGGVGVGFANLKRGARCPDGSCPSGTPGTGQIPVPPETPELVALFDVTRWEGISFWGRRGPNSQAAVRVGLGDKHTDDDVSFLMYEADKTRPRHCERNRECGCTNLSKSCSAYADPAAVPGGAQGLTGFYCRNPDVDPVPSMTPNEYRDPRGYMTCNTTKCEESYAAYPNDSNNNARKDLAFNGRPCTPYSFSNGTGASYCFDPATDPPPYDNTQTCGDHWVFPVTLTTDWHLYFVPFTVLQQQGFGKKFARPELAAASMLRLMWDVGWVDYWVDDVGFYRRVGN